MEFEISRQALLTPLRLLTGIVERKQTLPILGNILVVLEDGMLHLTSTDSELEMSCKVAADSGSDGRTTIPALKLFEICRSLGDDAQLQVKQDASRVTLKSGRSRFSLTFLPAEDFPAGEDVAPELTFTVPQNTLKWLFAKTQFAMAQQDVRYYLNGLLLEVNSDRLRVVATDGHRLAMAQESVEAEVPERRQIIVPRKAVLELARSLEDSDDPVELGLASNHIRFTLPTFTLTSKLIDGNFPDYTGVIPAQPEKNVVADSAAFKQALGRAAILSSDKYKGVRLGISPGQLQVTAHNPEQEEAEEELDVEYQGEEFEIGFNVTYLQDALGAIDTDEAELYFTDTNSSCLLSPRDTDDLKYVIMPMRL